AVVPPRRDTDAPPRRSPREACAATPARARIGFIAPRRRGATPAGATMPAMPNAPVAAQRIETARLRLLASDTALLPPVLDFYARNQAHFGPWDPPLPPDFLSTRRQRQRLSQHRRAF